VTAVVYVGARGGGGSRPFVFPLDEWYHIFRKFCGKTVDSCVGYESLLRVLKVVWMAVRFIMYDDDVFSPRKEGMKSVFGKTKPMLLIFHHTVFFFHAFRVVS